MQLLCRFFFLRYSVSYGAQNRVWIGTLWGNEKNRDWWTFSFECIPAYKKKTTHREWTQEFTLSFHLWACFVIFNSTTESWYLYRKTGYFFPFPAKCEWQALRFQLLLMKNIQANWYIAWKFQQYPPMQLHCYVTNKIMNSLSFCTGHSIIQAKTDADLCIADLLSFRLRKC